jgi:hypothetical protein
MPITLQFVREAHMASGLIAWFGAGEFSHVDAVFPDGRLLGARHRPIGGTEGGVQIRPADYSTFVRRVVMEVPCSDEQEQGFYGYLRNQVGKPYDSSAIWGFVTGRDWRNPERWICSELLPAAAEFVHILPRLYVPANKITPVGCCLAFSAIGGVVVVSV